MFNVLFLLYSSSNKIIYYINKNKGLLGQETSGPQARLKFDQQQIKIIKRKRKVGSN